MRAFEKEEDLVELNSWLIRNGKDPLDLPDVPKYGMLIPDVACGFICRTDTNVVFLECFVTNPEASPEKRHEALNKLGEWGLNTMKLMGAKRCLVLSEDASLIKRAIELGFEFKPTIIGHKLLR